MHLEEHLDLVLVVSLGLAGYLLRYFKDEMRAWCSKWVDLKQWRVLVAGCMITLLSTCHNIKYQSQHFIWLHQ